ncbi:MAG: hypothetical protein GY771_08640 [bacterium]|nr:hypothetical protein [bacterium]
MSKLIRGTSFGVGFEPQCFIRQVGVSVTCKVTEIIGAEYAAPGDTLEITLKLIKPVMIYEGDQLIVRESNKMVAQGKVIKLIE